MKHLSLHFDRSQSRNGRLDRSIHDRLWPPQLIKGSTNDTSGDGDGGAEERRRVEYPIRVFFCAEMEQESKKREGKETEFQSPSVPVLCPNNCGFFGSSATNNLCSKCYRDAFLRKTKDHLKAGGSGDDDVAAKGGSLGEAGADEGAEKKPTNRCSFCNKKVGLMGFKCRCDDVFCSLHHYSDKHNCLFDYKGFGQDAIAKSNPIVKADKMDKI